MTTVDNTLLAHIVPLYGKTELVATEALRYILQQSESARNALESMMVDAGVEVGSLSRFQTEATGEEGERVDLVCYDEAGAERVLVEAKFWAGLTDNQPNTYLARLPEEGHSVLLFVAPVQRMETLWPELCERAQKDEQYKLAVLSESGDLRNVAVEGSERKMMLTSWRAVLERMVSRANIAGDAAAVRDIEQLLGLAERMDSDAFLPIHSDELAQEFPRRILNLANLIDDATQKVVSYDWADASSLRSTSQRYGYGRYFRLDGIMVWFGINFFHWAGTGQSPLWIQPQQGDYLWHPISLPTGVEYAGVLDSVVDQLDLMGQYFKSQYGE